MTERNALFLASLSHRWFLMVLPLPVVFGLATYYVSRLGKRTHAEARPLEQCFHSGLRITSKVLLAASVALLVVAFLHVGCASLAAHSTQCLSNLKQLSIGAFLYAQDYDERLPASARWAKAIDTRVKNAAATSDSPSDHDPFRCPAATSPWSYGMNALLGGKTQEEIEAPLTTVLFFDADAPRRSFAGGPGEVAWRRHNDTPNVVFADGHAKRANVFVLKSLTWIPTTENQAKRIQAEH